MSTEQPPRPQRSRAPIFFALGTLMFLMWVGLGGCSLGSVVGGGGGVPTPTETALPTEPPGPTVTPDPVRADDIIYIRKYIFGLSGDAYLVHTDGRSPRQITHLTRDQDSAATDFPVWSPDRSAIAFASEYRDLYNKAVWNLFTGDPNGGGVQQITGLPVTNGGFFPTIPLTATEDGISIWAKATVPPGATVTGRVLANGVPVEGALVVSWIGSGFTQTAADGTYSLEVPAGRGWIKATSEEGASWVEVDVTLGQPTTAPDIELDISLLNASYIQPGWDLDGTGLWSTYSRHWFDPTSKEPVFEQSLVHVNIDGSDLREVYQAQGITLGRPRVRPNHPDQVALVDGSDLLLLTVDMAAEGNVGLVKERRVLLSNVQRSAPVSWSPDGETIYYTVENGDINVDLMSLSLAGGASSLIFTFEPNLRDQAGFDTSPDGTRFVYENRGDMYIYDPASGQSSHITFYGAGSQPSWSGR